MADRWTDDKNFSKGWGGTENFLTHSRLAIIFEHMRSNGWRDFWTASCDVSSISCFCELEQVHGVGEVHTDIHLKTANRKEHFCVRDHKSVKFF